MNELMIFNNPEFGEIRTIEEDGKVLFCAKDVATALGYKNTRDAINRHCKGVVKRDGVSHTTNQHGTTTEQTVEMAFIPEGDIYRLAAKSELPGAERFESWIFDEVLPSIRKHGAYMTPEALEKAVLNPDFLIRLAGELKQEQTRRLQAELERDSLRVENEQQRQAIAEFKPMRQYLDTILSSEGTMATTQIAADYDISAKQLNKILHEEGLQRNVNGQWILYREHMGKGYTKSETISITRSDGRPDTKMYTKWTQKGRVLIHNILTRRGILPVMDRKAS